MLKECQVRSGDWNNNIYYVTVIHIWGSVSTCVPVGVACRPVSVIYSVHVNALVKF